MADADAESHFVQDISAELEANTWRWTGKRPTIRLHPDSKQKLVYCIDFAIAGATLQKTGPVTLSFFVNGHLLDRVRYASEGRRQLKKPVPSEWIRADQDALLAAEVDRVWQPPPPSNATLGFLLMALGFEPQQ